MGIAFPAEPCSGSQSFSIKAEKVLADSFAADTGACDLCCILKVTPPGGEPRAKPLWEAAGLPQVGTLGAPVSQSSGGTTRGRVPCPVSVASVAHDRGWPSGESPGVFAGPALRQAWSFISSFLSVRWLKKLKCGWWRILAPRVHAVSQRLLDLGTCVYIRK